MLKPDEGLPLEPERPDKGHRAFEAELGRRTGELATLLPLQALSRAVKEASARIGS